MTESIYIEFANSFIDAEKKQEGSGYYILGLPVPMKLLYDLYLKFLKDGVEPIEQIPKDKKEKYYGISKKYYTEMSDRIKASKACYALDLIASND